MSRKQPTPGEIVIIAAGGVALIASFLNYFPDTSAWGRGAFPIVTLIPLYCVVMALQLVLTKFANVQLPRRVAGFAWEQIHLALGLFATVMAVGWLIVGDLKIGAYILLLASIAALVGAFVLQRERHTGAI